MANTDRTPPHDAAAERGVVGSILIDPRRLDEVAGIIQASDFHNDALATLYRHLREMSDAVQVIDVELLTDRLRRSGDLATIGGTAFLAELLQSVPVAAHAVHYAKIVARDSRKRQIIRTATVMLSDAYDLKADPDEVLSAAESALANIKTGIYENAPVSMYDAVVKAMTEIDGILKRKRTPGVMIGLPEFDEEIGGVFPGELTILAARPAQGKTSLGLQWAVHCAARGRRTYFATLEMAATELALKQLSTEAGVSSQRIRSGRITEDDRKYLADAAGRVALKNLVLHDWPEIRPFDIQRAARRIDAEIIFADYLQCITPPDGKKKRYEQVGDISRQLKIIARQMQIPVVACCQIGRQADQRTDSRPKLSDLRESGNIEQDADVVLMLYRPDEPIKAPKGTPYEGETWDAELDVAKNRKGVRRRFRLTWDGSRTAFSCYGRTWEGQGGGVDWTPQSAFQG